MMFFMERKVTGAQLYQSNQRQVELSNLVDEYAPLIKRMAEQIKWKLPHGIELDDLIQSGIIGLFEAHEKFLIEYKASFKTYATIKIKYAIFESIRKHTGITRELSQSIKKISSAINELEQQESSQSTTKMLTEKLGISHTQYARISEEINIINASSFEELSEEQRSEQALQNPLFFTANEQIRSQLKSTINNLPKRDQLILSLYYNEFLGFKEIGNIVQLTEARVSQIHSELLTKLKERLRHLSTDYAESEQ